MHTTEQVLEETEAALQVAHMAQMIARLACELKKVSPQHPLPGVAGQYLERHALHCARHEPAEVALDAEPEPELDAGAGYAEGHDCPERRRSTSDRPRDDAFTRTIKAIA
jgi:hypothetical protein